MSDPIARILAVNSMCAACFSERATRRYCTGRCVPGDGPGVYERADVCDGKGPTPHMHRICRRCGYEWLERCIAVGVEAETT